jgi:hypothetical protein
MAMTLDDPPTEIERRSRFRGTQISERAIGGSLCSTDLE